MEQFDIHQKVQKEELREILFDLTQICELFIEAEKIEKQMKEKAVL